MLKLLLLLVSLAVLWWFVRNDASEYAAFKRLTDTAGRQRFYRVWVLKSFLALFGTSIVCLLILRQLQALLYLPDEFIPLAARLGADMPTTGLLDKEFLAGCASRRDGNRHPAGRVDREEAEDLACHAGRH